MKVKAKFLTGLLGGALVALPAVGLSSCGLVREDLPECPTPVVELRFIYEYHMEAGNAFHKQVDCLSAYFYDSKGSLVTVETVTDRDILADEGYRMRPDLEPGDYHVVAYGGMDCENSSFFFTKKLSEDSPLSDLRVRLDPACLTDPDRKRLHNQFYGAADFTVTANEGAYATVEMMRNTNSIQVALQHIDGRPIDYNDFIFEITDDNNDFDCDNNLLPTGEITYTPYNLENRSTGVDDDQQEWCAALAQFTTSRLYYNKPTRTMLKVTRVSDGETVFNIPLLNYMLLFKHENTNLGLDYIMGDQEYLDRENSWNFVFFLDSGYMWVSTRIIINDWEVRFNNPNF
ncbi:MAG: FimB/Mfa2 family fimbrial subunit [Muribaculaceae bacterium]|nr:FimB/Mfa2 family fimbrial subunit [Muribaculaceae bacterium]